MQPGYDDNCTDDSFLEAMVMNSNVVKRDLLKVMLDSISISQYLCIVALVVIVWTQTLRSAIDKAALLSIDAILLFLGFFVILLATSQLSLQLLSRYLLKVSFFVSGLYILVPIYHTLTRCISSDSIWALSALLIIIHLYLHSYSGYAIILPGSQNNPSLASNISLNASIVSSILVASRLPSRLHVFAYYKNATDLLERLVVAFYSLKKELFEDLHVVSRKQLLRAHRASEVVLCDVYFSSYPRTTLFCPSLPCAAEFSLRALKEFVFRHGPKR